MDDEEDADTKTKVGRLTVETTEHVYTSLSEGDNQGKNCTTISWIFLRRVYVYVELTFLGSLVQFTIGLQVHVNVKEMGASQKLLSG